MPTRPLQILLIEDDRTLGGYTAQSLREVGHLVDHQLDGRSGLLQAMTERFDVILLDRMLPYVEGLKILASLRASGDETPVLIMSALGDTDERVRGLRAGGDDYLAKPFAVSELIARVEALGRRTSSQIAVEATVMTVGDLEVDLLAHSAMRAGIAIDLTNREFRILEFLMRHAGRVVTRSMLLESVWDYHFNPQTNIIDQHLHRLRLKIDRDFAEPMIHTVRGAGYVLKAGR